MKRLLFFALLLIGYSVDAQFIKPNNSYGTIFNRVSPDSTFFGPTGCGAPSLNSVELKKFAIFMDSCNHRFWLYDPKLSAWDSIHLGASGGSSGPFYDSVIMKSVYRARQDSLALAALANIIPTLSQVLAAGSSIGSSNRLIKGVGSNDLLFDSLHNYEIRYTNRVKIYADGGQASLTVGPTYFRVVAGDSAFIDNPTGLFSVKPPAALYSTLKLPGIGAPVSDSSTYYLLGANKSTGDVKPVYWIAGGGGSGSPGGSNQQFQINNSSTFGGTRRITYNTSTQQTTFDSALVRMNINQTNVPGLSYYMPNISGVFSGIINQIFPSFQSDTNYVTFSTRIGGSDNTDLTHDNVVKFGWNIDGQDNPNKMGYWRSFESNYLGAHIGENHLMSYHYPGYTEIRGLSNYFDPHHAVGYGASNRATLGLATSAWDFRGTVWTYSNLLDKPGAGLSIDTSGNGTIVMFNDSLQTLMGSGFGKGVFQFNPALAPSTGSLLNMGGWDAVNIAGTLFDKATGSMSTSGTLGAGVVSGTTLNFNSASSITVDNTYPFIRNPGQINGIMGIQAGQFLNSSLAAFNDLMGYQAMRSLTSGSRNLAWGAQAGQSVTTGSGNIVAGVGAAQGANFSKSVVIGDSAAIGASGIVSFLGLSDFSNLLWVNNKPDSVPLIYGRFDTHKVGINTTNVTATLNVGGDLFVNRVDSVATGSVNNVVSWDTVDHKFKRIAMPSSGGGGAVITDATLTGDGTSGNHLKVDTSITATKARLMQVADSLGALIGGGGSTPTFEQTVIAGHTFSSNITIDGVNNTKNFIVQGVDSLRFIQNSYTESEGNFNITGPTSAVNFKAGSTNVNPQAYVKFDNNNGYLDLQTNYGYHMRFLNDVNEMARFSFGTRAFLINTTSPLGTEKLNINGSVVITDGTEGAGKVLTSDASGAASWQTPGGGGGATDITVTRNATNVTIASSTGSPGTLAAADATHAGALDTARAKFIDSLRASGALKFINVGTVGEWGGYARADSIFSKNIVGEIGGNVVSTNPDSSLLIKSPVRQLGDYFDDFTNASTTETDGYTYTVAPTVQPMNDGDKFLFTIAGVTVGHATATRTIKAYFGGTQIFTSGAFTNASSSSWEISGWIIRNGTTARCSVKFKENGVTTANDILYTVVTSLDYTGNLLFKTTMQAGSTGAATNDITEKMGTFEWKAANTIFP